MGRSRTVIPSYAGYGLIENPRMVDAGWVVFDEGGDWVDGPHRTADIAETAAFDWRIGQLAVDDRPITQVCHATPCETCNAKADPACWACEGCGWNFDDWQPPQTTTQ